ncbi:MAG: hypothetical protein WD341_14820 [Tistlia sp.]|uniref:hypothetical protein n=1 Tax=Tistlia sp. TaxID=3057121 RepID=UPI0034A410AE
MLWLELRHMDRTAKIERSLALIERFHGGEVARARGVLDDVAFSYNARLRTAPESQRPNDKQIAQIAVGEMLSESATSRAKLSELLLVTRFLDEAALCVEAGLCRRDIVCQYLTTYARGLYATFGAAIEEYRRINDLGNLGLGVDRMRNYTCEPAFS